jgi:hypothetical protein
VASVDAAEICHKPPAIATNPAAMVNLTSIHRSITGELGRASA